MSCSRNILWNLAYPLTVNRVRLSASLTVICWHLRLGRRLGAFQIHTIRWRHIRLAPLTVTVIVSVAFRNVSIELKCDTIIGLQNVSSSDMKNMSDSSNIKGVNLGVDQYSSESDMAVDHRSRGSRTKRTELGPRSCEFAGCPGYSIRYVRHFAGNHLPWFVIPQTACWECGRNRVQVKQLQKHLLHEHNLRIDNLDAYTHRSIPFFVTQIETILMSIATDLKEYLYFLVWQRRRRGANTEESPIRWLSRHRTRFMKVIYFVSLVCFFETSFCQPSMSSVDFVCTTFCETGAVRSWIVARWCEHGQFFLLVPWLCHWCPLSSMHDCGAGPSEATTNLVPHRRQGQSCSRFSTCPG